MPVQPKKILFLVPYPLKESPSQRFRFEQYFALLTKEGFQFEIQSFLDLSNWQLYFKPGKPLMKVATLTWGFLKRAIMLLRAHRYDFIFIHREATPIGPPIFEWVLARVLKRKIIYDFDDAIWLTDRTTESTLLTFLKSRGKVRSICRWSYKVSCGNPFLVSFAKNFNARAILNPTTVDTKLVHNPSLYQKKVAEKVGVVIGWTGSHSTLKYLQGAKDILERIERKFPEVQIAIIADRKPELNLKTLHFIPWRPQSEVSDLMYFDIGIMPLPDDLWARGKCGFKAIQYMALQIPAVASPVGANINIIDNGKNGFLCSSDDEWETALTKLILDKKLREKMGEIGRNKIIDHYSVLSNSTTFLALFA